MENLGISYFLGEHFASVLCDMNTPQKAGNMCNSVLFDSPTLSHPRGHDLLFLALCEIHAIATQPASKRDGSLIHCPFSLPTPVPISLSTLVSSTHPSLRSLPYFSHSYFSSPFPSASSAPYSLM